MFKINKGNQMNIFDNTLYLSEYHQRLLDNGWASYFRKNIFPKIREEKFSVLYSDKASRPNTPVNIMIGLLILKELNGSTDNELMESLIFDLRYQYALCTTSMEKQPISRNAFTNFRNALIKYEMETGIDLYKEEIIYLSKEIDKCSKKDASLKRMDSMMISSSCKHLSRIDLVYKVNINLIETVQNKDENLLGEREKEYLKTGFKQEAVYSVTKDNQNEKLILLLKDSKMLYDKYKENEDINKTEEFSLLDRLLNEQVDNTTGTPKESKDIKPDSLQNPSDPDATYRFKYGNNIGYVANVVENIHDNGEIYITEYDVKKNIYSDVNFMEDYIENKNNEYSETTLVDAAYYSETIKDKALEKNIELIPTQTMGKKQTNTEISNFKIDEENHLILECPNGQSPTSTKYNDENHKYSAKFDKTKCDICPLRNKCENAWIIKGKKSSVSFTEETYHKSVLEAQMSTEEYKKISNHRAGIEGTMSTLRRRYNVDKCPTKGLLHLKLKFGGSILSININKAIKYNIKETKNSISNLVISNINNLLCNFFIIDLVFKNI